MHELAEKLHHQSMMVQRQNKLFFKLLFSEFAQNFIFNDISSRIVKMYGFHYTLPFVIQIHKNKGICFI